MSVPCRPCPIPKVNLYARKFYARQVGGTGSLAFTLAFQASNPAPDLLPSGRNAYWTSGCVTSPVDEATYLGTTYLRFFFGCFAPGPGALFIAEVYPSEADCSARTGRLMLDRYPDSFGHRLVGVGDCSTYDLRLCSNLQGLGCDNPFPPYYTVSERP